MTKLVVAKFGGSTLGINGESIPQIVNRVRVLAKDSKVIAVFSAPLTVKQGKRLSITDVILACGDAAEKGSRQTLDFVRSVYDVILKQVHDKYKKDCADTIDIHLEKTQNALDEAFEKRAFVDETRARALAFSGEILMSHIMRWILKSNDMLVDAVDITDWPIITDENAESANFMPGVSRNRMSGISRMLEHNDIVAIGGFIGKTVRGTITTYERGGTDRTAADMAILFHKIYDTRIDFEKDSAVVSADPKIVKSGLSDIPYMSYNEARLAGMFGMNILDPIAIKEIVENCVDVPIIITDINRPNKITSIQRNPIEKSVNPIKIVVGKKNCAIFRIEFSMAHQLLVSLANDKRYGEFVILSPFTKDEIMFFRILFLDADYVKRNERYFLSFDPLATIQYNRGVITLIGDEMYRAQQIVSRASMQIGLEGLNILNMDAQEETSRIIIVLDSANDNIERSIVALHKEIDSIT